MIDLLNIILENTHKCLRHAEFGTWLRGTQFEI